ncbi:hypothetical protein FN846DRAFT_893929 [Sphaerosporella brunnea]|uniref:Uncharacterized protein n=1 Tax=Sphaerosporella brunnea TaxID=1250544 RepID=A0A5J5EKT6_9PEZI|nr:hypothetical protein FN846DRAFT_893929 [Sphaerosporella brunnea]
MFLVARFLLGMGMLFALSGTTPPLKAAKNSEADTAIIGELAYQKKIPFLNAAFNVNWYVGGTIAAGVTMGTFQLPSVGLADPFRTADSPARYRFDLHLGLSRESQMVALPGPLREEAWECLVKYHGEGDPNNEIVKADYAEMKATMAMELESNSRAWLELVSTQANRRRCALVAFIGAYSQLSGNGLVSCYLPRVLDTAGITSKRMQNKRGKINLSLNC